MRRLVSLAVVSAALLGCQAGANTQATVTTVQKAAGSIPATTLSGYVAAPKSLLGEGASVISVGGGNVISVGGGNVISVGGGNVISVGGGNFADRTLLQTADATAAMTTTSATTTTVTDGLAQVAGTFIAVYDLKKNVLKTFKSDGNGEFTVKGLPKNQILAMRTIFQTGGKEYYLSTLFRLDKDKDKMPLDPINTVVEAAFYKHLAGKTDKARSVSMGLLQTLWTHANALDITFDTTDLESARTLDELVKVYEDKVVARFPEGGEARTTYQDFIKSLQ